MICVMMTMAGLPIYDNLFGSRAYLAPALATAAVSGGIAYLAGALHWRPAVAAVAAVAGFAVVTPYAVSWEVSGYGIPGWQALGQASAGSLYGVGRLLTLSLPVDVTPETLMFPLALLWSGAFLSVSLALRTRSVLAPVAPNLAVLAVECSLAAAGTGRFLTVAAVFAGLTGLLILLRGNRRPSWRTLLSGASLVAMLTLVSLAGVAHQQWVSGRQRADPRALVPEYVDVTTAVSPLAEVRAQLREKPPRPLFTLRGSDSAIAGELMRTVALESYNGSVWTTGDWYRVCGQRLAPDPWLTAPVDSGTKVSMEVTIDGLGGQFLPVLGRPLTVEDRRAQRHRLGFSAASGVLVTEGVSARFSYALTAELKKRDDGLAQRVPSAVTPVDGQQPWEPSILRGLAWRIAQYETTPYAKLVAIEKHLREKPYTTDAPPGHSVAAMLRMLSPVNPHDDDGYEEQRAAAFAMLARDLGYPARVAVGYRLPSAQDGVIKVSTSDAYAWAEVHFHGYGWVAFDPTDRGRKPSDQPPPPIDGLISPSPTVRPPFPTPTPAVTETSQGTEGGAEPAMLLPPGPNPWAVAGLVTLLCLLLAAIAIVGAKKYRRWLRRHAATSSARILGAWRESLDRLTESGTPPPRTATATEVVPHVRTAWPTTEQTVAKLAPLATAAVFSSRPPGDEDVAQAWRLERNLHRLLHQGNRWRWVGRLLCLFDPRPLRSPWREKPLPHKSLTGRP